MPLPGKAAPGWRPRCSGRRRGRRRHRRWSAAGRPPAPPPTGRSPSDRCHLTASRLRAACRFRYGRLPAPRRLGAGRVRLPRSTLAWQIVRTLRTSAVRPLTPNEQPPRTTPTHQAPAVEQPTPDPQPLPTTRPATLRTSAVRPLTRKEQPPLWRGPPLPVRLPPCDARCFPPFARGRIPSHQRAILIQTIRPSPLAGHLAALRQRRGSGPPPSSRRCRPGWQPAGSTACRRSAGPSPGSARSRPPPGSIRCAPGPLPHPVRRSQVVPAP